MRRLHSRLSTLVVCVGSLAWTHPALAQLQQAPAAQSTQPPQRTIRDNRVITGRGDAKQDDVQRNAPSVAAMESVLGSTENLNAVRDAYLRRLSGDGCPPDVTIRVAALRQKLRESEARTGNGSHTTGGASQTSIVDLETSMLVLASEWYNRPADSSPAALSAANREDERARLLNAVLALRDGQDRAEQPLNPAQLKAELETLLAGCQSSNR